MVRATGDMILCQLGGFCEVRWIPLADSTKECDIQMVVVEESGGTSDMGYGQALANLTLEGNGDMEPTAVIG